MVERERLGDKWKELEKYNAKVERKDLGSSTIEGRNRGKGEERSANGDLGSKGRKRLGEELLLHAKTCVRAAVRIRHQADEGEEISRRRVQRCECYMCGPM